MAKPNYSFEKRKKELDRKRKQEEKLLRKKEKVEDTEAGREAIIQDEQVGSDQGHG